MDQDETLPEHGGADPAATSHIESQRPDEATDAAPSVTPSLSGFGSDLCQRCKAIEFDDLKFSDQVTRDASEQAGVFHYAYPRYMMIDYEMEDTWPELPGLNLTAAAGCGFCGFLIPGIRALGESLGKELTLSCDHVTIRDPRYIKGPKQNWLDSPKVRAEKAENAGLMELSATIIFWHLENDYETMLTFEIDALPDRCSQWLNIKRRHLESNPMSNSSIERLKGWLEECSTTCCFHVNDPSYLPTRILDLGDPNGIEAVCLVITADEKNFPKHASSKPRYAALSHCWGSAPLPPPLKATSNSVPEFMKCIPVASMPKTYQDAVAVTRRLGIRYLWIDSICIIQDSTSDWEKESERMADVYAHAFVTICAVQATSCHDGFLRRDPLSCLELGFRSSIKPDISGSFFLRPSTLTSRTTFTDIRRSKWAGRGWTFQENYLSTRRLLFCDRMVHFDCKRMHEWEDGIQHQSYCTDLINILEGHEVQEKKFYRGWYRIIEVYSKTTLSFPADRLPAISGLATQIAQVTKGRYVAGLWEEDIAVGLLWGTLQNIAVTAACLPQTLEDLATTVAGPMEYIAPSWSWASSDREVYHQGDGDMDPELEIIDMGATVEGLNPYGRISHAYLTVSAKVAQIPSPSLWLDCWGDFEILSHDDPVFSCLFDRLRGDQVSLVETHQLRKLMVPQLMARISMAVITSSSYNANRRVDVYDGLLLLPAEREHEYRRVGIFDENLRKKGGISGSFFRDVPFKTITLV